MTLPPWQVYSDGGARGNPGPAAVGVVVCDPRGRVVREHAESIGEATNNQAEYRALAKALTLASELGASAVRCFLDSQLVVRQLTGVYPVKHPGLIPLAQEIIRISRRFTHVSYHHVLRSHRMIQRADHLLNQSLDRIKAKGEPEA
ncbi:MAG: ribonuclease HI family protein [Elusimicrobia bacterium]|nr:ribonuclease HI family protein [Elusimicrobiota bacterium]